MTVTTDIARRIQITASGGQVNFPFNFKIFDASDLLVYLTPVGQTFDIINDLLILTTDYTVTILTPPTEGGTVILVVAAAAGDIITIDSDVAATQDQDYTVGGTFTGASLNRVVDKLTILQQQVESLIEDQGVTYEVGLPLATDKSDNNLPILAANQFWRKNPTNTGLVATTLAEPSDVSALRSDLANDLNGTDGARLVGYFDTSAGSITTKIKLDNLTNAISTQVARKNLIIGGDFSLNPWQRGTSFVGIATNVYAADRFFNTKVGTMVTDISKSLDAPTVAQADVFTQHSFLSEVTTADVALGAGDTYNLGYRIEGRDWTRLAERPFTFTFWVKAFKTGIYSVAFRNSGFDRSYVAPFTVDASDTWEKKSITVAASPSAGTWNFTNGIGVDIRFVIGIGTTFHTTTPNSWETGNFLGTASNVNGVDATANNFRIDLVQIEEGSDSTSFELQGQTEVIAACQRYYEKSYTQGVDPGTITIAGDTNARMSGVVSGAPIGMQFFGVEKRGLPTIVIFSTNSGASGVVFNITAAADRADGTGSRISTRAFSCQFTQNPTTLGDQEFISWQWTAEAEL